MDLRTKQSARKPMLPFTQEYKEKLHVAWQRFINYDDEDFDYSFIRPIIFESWKRSRDFKVNPYERKSLLLTSSQISELIRSNSLLIEIVRPYMERLYSIVKGSGYYLLLCDKDGYILDLIGDPEMIAQGKENLLIVGANRSESLAGTNAIGTCLAAREPLQIWDNEHYAATHKHFSCSSAPIFDESGNLLGCLDITGQYTEVHSHTLGMVLSAVDGITKEMKIRKAYQDIAAMSAQRSSILESVNSGLVLLNENDEIIQLNGNAYRMLHLSGQNAIGENINNFISIDEPDLKCNFYELKKSINNKETNIYFKGFNQSPVKYRLTVNFVGEDGLYDGGTVIKLDESKYINKLVNTIGGFKASYTVDDIIGSSHATKALKSLCKKAALSSSNILILGESGTGKELVAQSIHNASNYAKGPFVAINCAALPKGLIESELFGYEKGAFTGANKEGNPGKFELADGGTIFLDEIGDMPLDVQTTLLRVLQSKEVVRIGAKHQKKINVRVIAATNKNLIDEVEAKTFRQDLYYRLNVLAIHTPPLRNRDNDVCELAEHFVRTLNNPHGRAMKISPDVFPILKKYSWPGNIRELENAMERALNITDSDEIRPEHLPSQIIHKAPAHPTPAAPRFDDEVNPAKALDYKLNGYMLIKSSLEQTNGNVKHAAELLGISRRTLYRKMDKYGIEYKDYRD